MDQPDEQGAGDRDAVACAGAVSWTWIWWRAAEAGGADGYGWDDFDDGGFDFEESAGLCEHTREESERAGYEGQAERYGGGEGEREREDTVEREGTGWEGAQGVE